MQLPIQKKLAAAVLLSLAVVLPSAHAQTDGNTLEAPGDRGVVFPNEGTWPVWQDKSTSTSMSTSTTVEAAPDGSLGGAILNPFSQPAELPAPSRAPAPAPAPAAVATPPTPPESESTTSFTLMAIAAGAVLAGFALRRFHAPRRRSA
jgi:hypothetical protein